MMDLNEKVVVITGAGSFVPQMLAGGHDGHVVNVSSMGGLTPTPQLAPYAASKHAVVGLSKTLREELRTVGASIGVSVVCPGGVKSEIMTGTAAKYAPGSLSAQAQAVLDGLTTTVASGISGDAAGEIILKAVRENRFWVFPNAEPYFSIVEDEYEAMRKALHPSATGVSGH